MLLVSFLPIPIGWAFVFLILQHIFVRHVNDAYEWWKLRKAHGQCLSALTKIILFMQIGNSLRSSLDHLVRTERDQFWKLQWRRMAEIVAFSPQEIDFMSPLLAKFARDLVRCDDLSFQQRHYLIELRGIYRKESDFRRRSGQSLMQLRFQAVILLGLHLAVTLFMSLQFGWAPFKTIYLLSFLMMSAGLFLLLRIGKGVSWKT
jgi:hypothetical protein